MIRPVIGREEMRGKEKERITSITVTVTNGIKVTAFETINITLHH